MKTPFASELDNLRLNNRFLRLFVTGLMVLVIIMAMGWWRSVGNERTILVPPEFHKTVWVDSETVSDSYLEEMAYFMSSLVLNVTPESVHYQGEKLLSYSVPEERGALKIALDVNESKIVANSASTVFHPASIAVGKDKNAMKVSMTGGLSTFIGDKKIQDARKTFVASFAYRLGKVYLKSFKEAEQDDPFGEKNATPTSTIFIQR